MSSQPDIRTWFERRTAAQDPTTQVILRLSAVAVLAAAPLALFVGGAVYLVARQRRWQWVAPAMVSVIGGLLVLGVGVEATWQLYLDALGVLVVAARTGDFAAAASWALLGLVPLSVLAGGVVGAILLTYRRLRRPAWRRPSKVASPRQLARTARRLATSLAGGEGWPPDGVPLGIDERGMTVVLADAELNAHSLLVGATGSGKTTTLMHLLHGGIRRQIPVVLLDMKGDPEVAALMRRRAADAGRPFYLFTFDGPTYWNPLARGDATELTNKLIATERWTEPHYKRAAAYWLQTLFALQPFLAEPAHFRRAYPDLWREAKAEASRQVGGGRDTMGDDAAAYVAVLAKAKLAATWAAGSVRRTSALQLSLHDVVRHLNIEALRAQVAALPEAVRQRPLDYIDALTKDQASAILGLTTRLALMAHSHAGDYLRSDDPDRTLDVYDAIRSGAVVVFSLDSARYPELAAQLGGIVIQDLTAVMGELLHDREWTARAYIAIDEISSLDGDHLLALLARARAAGMCVLLATQDLSDLDRIDIHFGSSVLANTAVKIIHRLDVPESSERMAKAAGTFETWKETIQIAHKSAGPLSLATGGSTGVGTLRPVHEFRVPPDELKTLGNGHAVVIRKVPTFELHRVRVTPVLSEASR